MPGQPPSDPSRRPPGPGHRPRPGLPGRPSRPSDPARGEGRASVTSALLVRSDLPRAAKGAIAASQALGGAALIALVLGAVAVALGWPLPAWTAMLVVLAWCLSWGVFAGVASGAWALAAAAAVGVPAAWAIGSGLAAPGPAGLPVLVGVPLAGLAAGLVGGAAVRVSWDRRQAERERRLAALPDWARDELGAAADGLDPGFRRDPGPAVVGSHSDPAVRLLAAVCRPLPGATVLAGEPAVAVNGSRVAVVAWGPRLDRADQAPPLPRLPEGASARVFVLREGTELDGGTELHDGPAPAPSGASGGFGRPAAPGASGRTGEGGTAGAVEIIATEPQELAAHLGAGTPPDGDARHGIAADLHARVLRALDGYPGSGER